MPATQEKLAPTSKRQIADRWTADLVKEGWTPVSTFFLRNYAILKPPISSHEAMFLIHLISHKWDKRAPYPALKTVASRMGVGAAAVRQHARHLERLGYLRREFRLAQPSRYHFDQLFTKLEEFRTKLRAE